MKTKAIFKSQASPSYKGYDREIYMSEYTPINKEHYKRLRTCAIFSLGINIFLLLVMVLR
jgi:hypothetical protein